MDLLLTITGSDIPLRHPQASGHKRWQTVFILAAHFTIIFTNKCKMYNQKWFSFNFGNNNFNDFKIKK